MRNYLLSLLLLQVGVVAGCQKETAYAPSVGGESVLTICVEGMAGVKSGATQNEKNINNLSIYVFNQDGMLDVSKTCTAAEIAQVGGSGLPFTVKTGTKTVYMLANFSGDPLTAAGSAVTVSALEAVSFTLAHNSTSSLLMTGSATASVVAGTGGSARIELTRPTARVALGSVTNRLPAPYGTINLRRAFLCNVVANDNVKGTADPATWYNQEARADHRVKASVIGTGSYQAEASALTFHTLGDNVAWNATKSYSEMFFYAFRNASTTGINGYNSTFAPTQTVLMVVVSISGTEYYYPVPLDHAIERNTDYRVDLTLIGLGNTVDEPFAKIRKADLTATVSVSNWTSGANYSETI